MVGGPDPVLWGVEVGLCLTDQAGYQVGLLGLDVADGNVGLAAQQVAQRVGRDHFDGNAWPTRRNSRTPIWCSLSAPCRRRVGWVGPGLRAAAGSEPVWAVCRKAFS